MIHPQTGIGILEVGHFYVITVGHFYVVIPNRNQFPFDVGEIIS